MFQPTNPEYAAAIARLSGALSEAPMGSTLSYRSLSKIAGGDVQERYRGLLSRAREQAEKLLGCCFESVRDIGVKRLASVDIPDVGLAAVRRVRRAARKGKRRLDRVNPNSLAPSEGRRLVGYSAMLGAIALIADGRKASAIALVADPAKPIPPENILDMFRQTP